MNSLFQKRIGNIGWSTLLRRGLSKSSDWSNPEINTIPNMITMSRILASPGIAYAIASDMKMLAFGGCLVFGFSDWLDGYLAKKLNQQTNFGAFLDPLADKVFIGSISIALVYKSLLPTTLVFIIVGRDVALISSSFFMRLIERPNGSSIFDTKDTATFVINPSMLSKVCS